MGESLLDLRMTERAKMAYSALGPEDRRLVDAWFDHLRNWRNDAFVRSKSTPVKSNDET
jgi:hypothetical protein